jgi:hypothetical protein
MLVLTVHAFHAPFPFSAATPQLTWRASGPQDTNRRATCLRTCTCSPSLAKCTWGHTSHSEQVAPERLGRSCRGYLGQLTRLEVFFGLGPDTGREWLSMSD